MDGTCHRVLYAVADSWDEANKRYRVTFALGPNVDGAREVLNIQRGNYSLRLLKWLVNPPLIEVSKLTRLLHQDVIVKLT